jgi:hypothetical protein
MRRSQFPMTEVCARILRRVRHSGGRFITVIPVPKKLWSNLRRWLAGVGSLLILAGCATDGGAAPEIDEVHLFGLPVAINLDNSPGPDAFSVRVFVSKSAQPKGVPIRRGTLEILLFDGAFAPNQPMPATPLRTWSFTAQQLKGVASENRLGTGYEFTLPWAGTPPRRNRVTVLARYRPVTGAAVVSGPSAISLSVR